MGRTHDIETLDHLQELLHVPPLPGTAARLIGLVSDPEVDLHELARVIEQDPALAARLVGVANSAWFARGREVVSVEEAIIRVLGLDLVRGLALGMTLGGAFDTSACAAFDAQRYAYLAFVTGSLARDLAGSADLAPAARDCAFLAGLLHDFGQLVLVHAFPRHMEQVLQAVGDRPLEARLEREREAFALDEVQAGRFVLRRWHLPACVIAALGSGHAGAESADAALGALAALVRWVAAAAARLYQDPGTEVADWFPELPAPPAPLPGEVAQRRLEQYREQDAELRRLARMLIDPNA